MNSIFIDHRECLNEQLEIGSTLLLFSGKAPKSTADAHYTFFPNKNFFYFTGLTQEHFIVMMSKTEKGIESTIFIEKPDYDIEKWIGRKLTKEVVEEKSGIQTIKYLDEFEPTLTKMFYNNSKAKLYLDLEKLSWDEMDSEALKFSREISKRFPFVKIETCQPIVTDLRVIKSEFEIHQMRRAIEMTHNGLNRVLKTLKPEMMEYQIEATFAHQIRMEGADGNSFPTIAASGKDAVILHYVENDKILSDGDLVLLDLGAQYKQYCADISRTYPVNGKFSDVQKKYYNIVLSAQQATIDAIKPGLLFDRLNEICKESLTKDLIAAGLIQNESELSKYYYHGVSHFLGLDVHDLGNRNTVLKPGMVLTVEPGLYIENENIGIRIEDNILVTEDGHENLSESIPKSVEDIESLMI